MRIRSSEAARARSEAEVSLGPVVEDKDEGSAHAAHDVCQETLVQTRSKAFLCRDLFETIAGALVKVLLGRLLGLHLQASAYSVEWVGRARSDGDRSLRRSERAYSTHNSLVLLVWVEPCNSVEGTKLQAAVADDAHDRNSETSVESEEATRSLHGLHDAVSETREALFARSYVRSQPGSRIVQRVDNAQAARRGQTTRHEVGTEELRKLGLRIVFREHCLEGVLECQIEGLRREIADAICEITVPKALHTLLFQNATSTINDSRVSWNFTASDLGVGILCLHDKLDALDGRCYGFGHGARDTPKQEVDEEIRLLGHVFECGKQEDSRLT